MSTQGLVTITVNGKTLLKAVAGCNGRNVYGLAALLLINKYKAISPVYHFAQVAGFGCPDCLIVFTRYGARFPGGVVSSLSKSKSPGWWPLYKQTFNKPLFNPQCDRGTVEHFVVIGYDESGEIVDVTDSLKRS